MKKRKNELRASSEILDIVTSKVINGIEEAIYYGDFEKIGKILPEELGALLVLLSNLPCIEEKTEL